MATQLGINKPAANFGLARQSLISTAGRFKCTYGRKFEKVQ